VFRSALVGDQQDEDETTTHREPPASQR